MFADFLSSFLRVFQGLAQYRGFLFGFFTLMDRQRISSDIAKKVIDGFREEKNVAFV